MNVRSNPLKLFPWSWSCLFRAFLSLSQSLYTSTRYCLLRWVRRRSQLDGSPHQTYSYNKISHYRRCLMASARHLLAPLASMTPRPKVILHPSVAGQLAASEVLLKTSSMRLWSTTSTNNSALGFGSVMAVEKSKVSCCENLAVITFHVPTSFEARNLPKPAPNSMYR